MGDNEYDEENDSKKATSSKSSKPSKPSKSVKSSKPRASAPPIMIKKDKDKKEKKEKKDKKEKESNALEELHRGAALLKYPRRSGFPHFKHIQLSEDNLRIEWFSKRKNLDQTCIFIKAFD